MPLIVRANITLLFDWCEPALPLPNLVSDWWYVQAKLVKYRTDSLEGGTLIEQLSAQTRQDTALIREQADKIDELQQQLNTQKVSL